MKFSDFDSNLNNLLMPWKFDDFCPNGCLVEPFLGDNRQVKKVVTGVSLRDELIDRAIKAKADVLVVHHPNGFWTSETDKRLVGTFGRYMSKLVRAGIALYGFHLPLDAHEELGNNICIARELELGDDDYKFQRQRFMEQDIGVIADTRVNKEVLDRVFPHGWQSFGPALKDQQYIVGICSGSGTSGLQDAIGCGCTMFVTGEIRESTPIFAQENGITVISAGHHRSEVFCVRALAEYISSSRDLFPGVRAQFIDIDNPI